MPIEKLDWDEFKERVDAAKASFRKGEITQKSFRMRLALLGFNATEIDSEVEEVLRQKKDWRNAY